MPYVEKSITLKMNNMQNRPDIWIWTEPLAFDNEAEDCGVAAYFDAMGFLPEGISLLLTSMDFVLQHENWTTEHVFPEDVCSRLGHHGNGVRNRQKWTNFQLKKLIGLIRERGVKVVFSQFPYNLRDKFHREFVSDHPECVTYGSFCMLSRFADGTLAEDYYVKKLCDVVDYYGFDGWHGPDGLGPFFHGIMCHDFGDAFARQFRDAVGKDKFPPEFDHDLAAPNDYAPQRMEWIWNNLRDEWIDFVTKRSLDAWRKINAAMHERGRITVINSPDTKGVFAGWYFSGFDYREIARMGVDIMVAETTITGFTLLKGQRDYLTELSAMMQEMTASMPGVKICMMPSIKDAVESYDSMIHMHGMFERDVHYLASRCIYRNGRLERTAKGFCVCLGDYLRRQDWQELDELLKNAWAFKPASSGELVWIHDPSMYETMRAQFRRTGVEESYFQIAKLEEIAGIDISSIATPDNLPSIDRPLIVPNFHLLSADVQRKILEKKQLTVIMGDLDNCSIPADAHVFRLPLIVGYTLSCAILNSGLPAEISNDDSAYSAEPFVSYRPSWNSYGDRPLHVEVPDSFWKRCGDAIRTALGPLPLEHSEKAPRVSFSGGGDAAKYLGLFRQWDENGDERIGVYSRIPRYATPTYQVGRDDVSITIRTEFPRGELCSREGWLLCDEPFGKPVHVPPCGILVADIAAARS